MAYSNEEMQQLLTRHGDSVYRLALARTRSSADAEDIFQEVFLRLVRSAPKLESPAHQRAWLLRVTVNCCKDLLKSAARRNLPLTDTLPDQPVPSPDEALSAALAALPEQARSIIHLHYYEGYKTEEIAHILEMKPATVRSQLKRAREKLKKLMEGADTE